MTHVWQTWPGDFKAKQRTSHPYSVPVEPHSVSFGESENQSQMLKGHLQYLIDSHRFSYIVSHDPIFAAFFYLPVTSSFYSHDTSHSLVLSIPLGGLLQSWNLLRLRGDPALRTTRDRSHGIHAAGLHGSRYPGSHYMSLPYDWGNKHPWSQASFVPRVPGF